jgi:hypothetical protein
MNANDSTLAPLVSKDVSMIRQDFSSIAKEPSGRDLEDGAIGGKSVSQNFEGKNNLDVMKDVPNERPASRADSIYYDVLDLLKVKSRTLVTYGAQDL